MYHVPVHSMVGLFSDLILSRASRKRDCASEPMYGGKMDGMLFTCVLPSIRQRLVPSNVLSLMITACRSLMYGDDYEHLSLLRNRPKCNQSPA